MKILELLKKELTLFKRKKKQIWTVILLPLLFSLIYNFMFSLNSVDLSISVCNLDSGQYSMQLIDGISSSFETSIINSNNFEECRDSIEEDIVKGTMIGIVVQESFSENIENYIQPELILYFDNSKPNLGFFARSYLMNQISGFNSDVLRNAEETIKESTNSIENDLGTTLSLLSIMNTSIPLVLSDSYNGLYDNVETYHSQISELNNIDLEFLVSPVTTSLIGVFSGDNSNGFSFSVLYTVLNIIVILLLSSVSIVYDKKNKFFTRLKTSTTPIIYYIISKLLFFILVGLLIFIPSFIVFNISNAYFNINFITLIISLIIVSVISTLIGSIIGLISKDESSSIMISIFIGFMFLLLSGLFYPIDLLPEAIKLILIILPTNFEINLLNNALVFNTNLAFISNTLYYLIGYIIVFGIINYVLILKDN